MVTLTRRSALAWFLAALPVHAQTSDEAAPPAEAPPTEVAPPAPPAEAPPTEVAPPAPPAAPPTEVAPPAPPAAPSATSPVSAPAPVVEPTVEEAPPEEEPVEVSVSGERPVAGKATFSAGEVRETPGAFGDAFRAVEVMPGVTPALGGVPYYFIRGMPPNDHGYFVDKVRVPLLFHVGLGPAVIHPGLLDRVDFYPGSAPARYGGFTGAIIEGKTREPALLPRGEAHLRLVDAGALVETPLFDDRATVLVAGRYGYPGPIVSAFSDTTLEYWDYQARGTWRASDDGTLTVLAFGSHDRIGQLQPSGEDEEQLLSDFHRLDLRFTQRLGDGSVEVGSAFGYDSQGADPTFLDNRSLEPRVDLEQPLSDSLRVRAGAEGRLDVYSVEQEETPPDEAFVPSSAAPARRNLTGTLYAELAWQATSRVELVPGVRATVFDSKRPAADADDRAVRTTVPAVDPRLSARIGLAPGLAWLSTAGVSHQYPVLRVGALPAVVAAGAGFPVDTQRLQRTVQQSQGLELELPAESVLTLTGFSSWSWGMTDLTRECIQIEPPSAPAGEGPRPDDPYYCPSNAPVRGRAYGVEVLLRRRLTERVGGLLSYTLSRAERESHFVTLDGEDEVATVPNDFDRTHVLNAIITGDLGRRWRAGARFVFYSGVPYSELAGNVPVPPYNSRRDPPFYRLDFRVEKRWPLGTRGAWALVFEVQNATLSQDANTLGMDCIGEANDVEYTTECRRGTVGPLTLPSVGVEAFF